MRMSAALWKTVFGRDDLTLLRVMHHRVMFISGTVPI